MEPERLAELVDLVADGPPESVRDRAALAIQIAWKAARKAMREEAASTRGVMRRRSRVRKIVRAEIMGLEV